jgi:CheY-like chemotaxis protein
MLQTDLPVGHGELVLVVDDEESIREITRGTLETFGYQVLTASDGTEALAIYADRKNDVAVVLTDMVMPFMDGPATIRALKKMNPAVKIIAASGLTAGNRVGEGQLEGVAIFLSKPYTAEKLLKALSEVVNT